jgi:hypothetical protein
LIRKPTSPISKDVRLLIEELAENGVSAPAIVLVGDYGERERLATALQEEAEVHGVGLVCAETVEKAAEILGTDSTDPRAALVLLVDAGTGAAWGAWLDASRELLPSFRFVVLLVIDTEFPKLARAAPALISWVKGNVVEKLLIDEREEEDEGEVEVELRDMERETGSDPADFVRRWEAGKIADTFRNNL